MAIAFDPGSATLTHAEIDLTAALTIPYRTPARGDQQAPTDDKAPAQVAVLAVDPERTSSLISSDIHNQIENAEDEHEDEDEEDEKDDDDDREYTYDQLSESAKQTARYEVIVDNWRAGWIADDIDEMVGQELDRYGFTNVEALFDNQYRIDMVFKAYLSPEDLIKGMATVRSDCAEGYTDTIAHDGVTIALLDLLERYPTHDIARLEFRVCNERYGQGLPRMYIECSLETWRDEDSLSARERLCLRRLELAKEKIEDAFEEFIKAVRARMTKMIEQEIEYRESDECIEEEIDANDNWRFDIDGNRI